MIDSLLLRELDRIKVLWIPSNNTKFEDLFSELGYDMFNIEQLFLGHCCPNLVITNNRFSYIDDIVNICNKYLANLVIIDHDKKTDIINIDKSLLKVQKIANVLQVAMGHDIYNSWDKIQDVIVEKGTINKTEFKNLIYQFAKRPYIK